MFLFFVIYVVHIFKFIYHFHIYFLVHVCFYSLCWTCFGAHFGSPSWPSNEAQTGGPNPGHAGPTTSVSGLLGFAWQAPRPTDPTIRPQQAFPMHWPIQSCMQVGHAFCTRRKPHLEVTSSRPSRPLHEAPHRVMSYDIPSIGGFHAAKPAPRHHLAVLARPKHWLACCMRCLAPEGQAFFPQANRPPLRTSAGCPIQAAPYLPCIAPHSTDSCQTKTTGYSSRALPSWHTLASQDPATSSENGASSAQPTCMPLRPLACMAPRMVHFPRHDPCWHPSSTRRLWAIKGRRKEGFRVGHTYTLYGRKKRIRRNKKKEEKREGSQEREERKRIGKAVSFFFSVDCRGFTKEKVFFVSFWGEQTEKVWEKGVYPWCISQVILTFHS